MSCSVSHLVHRCGISSRFITPQVYTDVWYKICKLGASSWKLHDTYFLTQPSCFFSACVTGGSLAPAQSELVPCMDAVNNNYMDTISMVKRYRPAHGNRRQTHISTTSITKSTWRESAAIKIQAVVRRHQAYSTWVSSSIDTTARSDKRMPTVWARLTCCSHIRSVVTGRTSRLF